MLEDSNRLFPKAANPNLKISIIVPVKDEEEIIVNTLNALRNQIDINGNPLDYNIYEVLLLVNNSVDKSEIICEEYALQFPEFNLHVSNINLPADVAHIGMVRRLMMDEAYERLTSVGVKRGIIVSTDGDSEVDVNWIYYIIKEMEKGVDVVGGRIIPKHIPRGSKWPHLRDVTYRFLASRLESKIDECFSDPWPRHFQCYGPSLAVTCEIYKKAGGMPPLPYLEDEEFRKSLKRIDARIRKSPLVKIYTSSRLVGRVEFGFSVQLKQWTEMQSIGAEQMVESLDSLSFKFINKRKLRLIWENYKQFAYLPKNFEKYSSILTIESKWLKHKLKNALYFEGLWEEIENQLHFTGNINIKRIPIHIAISELRMYFAAEKNLKIVQENIKQSDLSSGMAV